MSAIVLSLTAALSTSCGGLCAWWLRGRVQRLLDVSGGLLLGIAAFGLVPESFERARALAGGVPAALLALAVGAALSMVLRAHGRGAELSGLALAAHRVVDGLGIGMAFQVSSALGATVSLAVVAHDFCDGLSTVGLMLGRGHRMRSALRMLALNAGAPAIGAALSLVWQAPPTMAPWCFGMLAGVLLCNGASTVVAQLQWPCGVRCALRSTAPGLAGFALAGSILQWAGG